MSRAFVEKLSDPWWWAEQGAHAAIGFGLAVAVAYWLPVWASWGFSTLVSIGREIIQNWGDKNNDYLDMGSDMLFWSIGAALGSLVF